VDIYKERAMDLSSYSTSGVLDNRSGVYHMWSRREGASVQSWKTFLFMHTVWLCTFSHVESCLGAGANSVQGDLEVGEGDTQLVESRNRE